MDLNFIAGAAAAVALFVPVFLILAGRLYTNGSLFALLLYYLFSGLYNLMDLNLIPSSLLFRRQAGVLLNYLDAPLMLVVLLFFCSEKWKRNLVFSALALFLFFESIILVRFGVSLKGSVYLLGPGILLVLILSLLFFSYYGKMCIVQGKGLGKTFMLASVIFAYVIFLILYYLHYLMHSPDVTDVFFIYYIGILIAAALMSAGLVCIVRRQREIKERLLTRRELALFFDN